MVEQVEKLQKKPSKFDEAIKINVEDIVGKFADCTVCFDTFKDPYITKCGHTYCKDCIFEVVNRQHRCPACNTELQQANLIKNYNFGELLNNLIAEREIEKQKFIDQLVNKGVNQQ